MAIKSSGMLVAWACAAAPVAGVAQNALTTIVSRVDFAAPDQTLSEGVTVSPVPQPSAPALLTLGPALAVGHWRSTKRQLRWT